MTMVKPSLDLSQLALDRGPHSPSAEPKPLPRRKRWGIRYLLPIGILFGFVALLVAAAGNRLLPTRSVTVVPVVVQRAELQPAGTSLFQSPGWIEPRPMATGVAAMTSGVIEELMVVAGQQVERGEAVARLVAVDAELAREQAEHTLAIRHGELKRAQAELAAARVRLDNPVHLRVQLADARSSLSKSKTELGKLPFLIEAAQANLEYARNSMQGKQSAREAISGNVIARAENEHAVAMANLKELQERQPNLEREVTALEEVVQAIERQLELLVEETRQLQEAEAKVQAAEAYCDEARLQVRRAELTLERNTVRAPISGRVLRIIAAPGSRVMGLETTAGQSSSTVVEMYDPNQLQVRADVRLEDVPMVSQGQPVEIKTASSDSIIHGRVLQVTSSANIQKNTLEVKIELLDPPQAVSPEMLVAATFLAPATEASRKSVNEVEQTWVPASLVQSSGSGAIVWIVDENSLARKRAIELGGKANGELVVVHSGLKATDKLIATGRDGLRDGARVHVTGDDSQIGIK